MELIKELIEFALRCNWLTEENKRKLQENGFYTFYEDNDEYQRYSKDLREDELYRTYYDDIYVAGKRSIKREHRKRKRRTVGPELTVEELNQRVEKEWKKLTEDFPRLQTIWDSWKAGRLMQVFTDGFTLNDIYALMKIELQDYHDFSGPAPAAFRQLLRQVGNTVGKYSWVIKRPKTAVMVEFSRFRQQIIGEVRALYETDRKRFSALSSQNGKLNFPLWEKDVKKDTTSMKVWTLLNLSSMSATPEIIEEILTWKAERTIASQLNLDYITEQLAKLEKRDWSSLTVITERKIENAIIKSVAIPEGVKEIGNEAFSNCRSLISVTIPDGVRVIGERAFIGCSSLTFVAIPEGVTTIGHGAFSGCSSLTSVIIPECVTEIGKGAFYECAAPGKTLLSEDGRILLNVNKDISGKFVIPESVKVVAPNAFYECRSLTSIVIPEGMNEIGRCAFCGCAAHGKAMLSEDGRILLNVNQDISGNFVIPEGVRAIAASAFCKCSSITSVIILDDVKKIGDEAFMDCPNLTIHAPVGAYAEKYAIEKDILFQPLEEEK